MSGGHCGRAWQAEALQDGRLSQQDAASFERHVATCAVCTREVEALAQLEAVAERLPVLTSTPLEHRRLRQAVLRQAHASSTRAPRGPKLAWLALGALALAGAALVVWPRTAEAPAASPHAPPADVAPVYQANASADAVWHTAQPGRVLRLSLERGQLELTVAHLHLDQRFLVQLPDGELEVKGTRFVVHADGARTTAVRVIEGRVALRLRASAESLLEAGDVYTAPEREAPTATPRQTPSKPARAKRQPAEEQEATPSEPAAEPEAPEAPPQAPSDSTFARAMTAFGAGDFGHADALFEQFEREHPRDSRIEDALFLRAVARARRGDEQGARTIAREYLERFPNGLRKPDAERLAR